MGGKKMATRARLILLLALLQTQSASADPNTTFVYKGWLDPRDNCEIRPPQGQRHGTVVVGGDAFYKSDFCSSEDAFICVFSVFIDFAVPRVLGDQEKWEFRGHKFEVADRDISVRLLGGTQISGLILIRTPPKSDFSWKEDERQLHFLYSPKNGLVAFSWLHARGSTVVHWARDGVGFGSVGQ